MKYRVGSFFVYWLARLIAGTMRIETVGEEQIDKIVRETGKGVVLTTWHGRTFVPIAHFRKRAYWSMISTSRDGEYQARIFGRFGFRTVRGSSTARGAVQATLTLAKKLKEGGVVALTPDGPRGPRGQCHPGAIFLAQRAGCPLIPAGVSASRRWLLKSWDRYLIPKPFSHGVIVFGEPMRIPPGLSGEEQLEYAARLAAEIDRLEEEAERRVGAGGA